MANEKGIRDSVFAVVPSYMPDEHLVRVIDGLGNLPVIAGIVVVNDGSSPESEPIFEKVAELDAVHVIRHELNQGKGAALKSGFGYLIETHGEDIGIITVDADGQHAPDDISNVANEHLRKPSALTIGVRAFDQDVPFRSAIGNRLTRHVLKLFHGIEIADTQTGLRALGGKFAASTLSIPSDRYEFELDMLLMARADGVLIEQIPIRTIYLEGNKSSHFNIILDSTRIYFAMARFAFAGMAAAVIDNAIFWILTTQGIGILPSQIAGRTVASFVNYFMVKGMVFHSRSRHTFSAPRYIATVCLLGVLSYGMILLGSETLGMPAIAAKIVAETLIFIGNYVIQRTIVFPARDR